MKKVYQLRQKWVEYGPPCGPGDYYDKFGSDLKATFDTRAEAEAAMDKMKAELPDEEFDIWEVDPEPPAAKSSAR